MARRIRRVRPNRSSIPERLDVVHLTAECWPFARTGGLGEAVAGLSAYQAAARAGVSVVMPLYRVIRDAAAGLEPVGEPFGVPIGRRVEEARLYRTAAQRGKPRMFFIAHAPSFDRAGLYGEGGAGYPDNARRFALFCRAALQALPRIAPGALIVHAHDWHAALALVDLTAGPASHRFGGLLRVLSVHNAAFQGSFPPETVDDLGLPRELYDTRVLEAYGRMNFLKGGLSCCDLAVTVSPNHALELRTREGGFGLHGMFEALGDRLAGVANGIDVEIWDPAADAAIPSRYTRGDLSGKARCKAGLQRSCGLLETPSTTLFAMCTRLAEQKGLDLVLGADLLGQGDAQFVFVGHGEERYERALAGLAASAPDRIAFRPDFSDGLEHRLLAGADALLMPSLYEPCGLTQMRAQRYGTIPVARRVGGLVDTIDDGVTGFLFDDYARESFVAGVRLAATRHADGDRWREMVRQAMTRDFGWGAAAEQYVALYRRTRATATHAIASASTTVLADA
jgi:starch synthase